MTCSQCNRQGYYCFHLVCPDRLKTFYCDPHYREHEKTHVEEEAK